MTYSTTADTTSKSPEANAKMTTREKKWIVYDVGNSAFVLLSTAVVPLYANSLLKAAGETNIVSTWGYAQTIASPCSCRCSVPSPTCRA